MNQEQNPKNCCNIGLSTISSSALKLQELKYDELSNVADKILQSVNVAFERSDVIDEFDIIPQESQSNRSPVIHNNQKLALESWCVPFLYSHSFRHFLSLTQNLGKNYNRRYSPSLTSFNATDNLSGPGSVNEGFAGKNRTSVSHLSEFERRQKCLMLSRILILLNPHLTLAWNFRKETYRQGYTLFKEEIDLITLTTSRKPKCPEGFSYRSWLMQDYLQSENFKANHSFELFQSEANAVERAAIKYFSNYHAWNYRHFMLNLFLESKQVPEDQKNAILEYEKEVSDDWLKSHVSDHSGFHYRQKLLECITTIKGKFTGESIKVYLDELEENGKSILYYPGHECLWYHRRALLHLLTENTRTSDVENSKSCREDVLMIIQKNETQLIQLVTSDQNNRNKNVSEIEAGQENKQQLAFMSQVYLSLNMLYAERHVKWSKYSLGSF